MTGYSGSRKREKQIQTIKLIGLEGDMLTCCFQDYYFPICFLTRVTDFWKDIGINTPYRLCFSLLESHGVSKSADGWREKKRRKRKKIQPKAFISLTELWRNSQSQCRPLEESTQSAEKVKRNGSLFGRLWRGGVLTHREENMSSCVQKVPSCITTAILNLTTHIEILILPLATLTTEARL